ncbi:MAG: zinc ribbon domain-containing protein [Planctomycetota bacterium]|nr:zinc ribbon domain-containing protein [Planctomycetota bacterium]
MPIYEYAHDDGRCEKGPDRFEVLQKMSDPPLGVCPRCGGKVHRLISDVSTTVYKYSAKDAARAGFTQYRRAGKGIYEKEFGQGPGVISDGS